MIDILAPHKILIPLLVFSFMACSDLSEEDTQQIDEALSDSLTSVTETWGVDMDIIEEGEKKVRLTGSYAASYNTEELNETRIDGPIHIDVFDSTGAVETTVDSDRATYHPDDTEFEFFGNVRVNVKDERFLESEYLRWQQSGNQISTPDFVIIITPSDSIAGTGFEGTTDLDSYTIEQPQGRVTVD